MKWIVGVSVIAVALGWAATTTIPAATMTPDESTLRLFPPETQGIAFIDVAGLRDAPLVKNVFESYRPTIERLPEFMTAIGFLPQRDVDGVTVGRINERDVLAIVQARYDRFKAEQFFKDKGQEQQIYLGRAVFTFDVQEGQTYGLGGVTFLDNLIIAGHSDAVKKAIDQMSLPGSSPVRTSLVDAIRTLEAGSQVWAVGDFSPDQIPPGLRAPAPAIEILKSLRGGTYEMRVDEDIHAKAVGNFADAEAARNLSDLARGFLAVAKLQVAKEQPDLLHALDGIQIRSSGTSVVVNIDESGDLLKKLQNSGRQLRELHK